MSSGKSTSTDRRGFLSTLALGLASIARPSSASGTENPDKECSIISGKERKGLAYERIEYSLEAFIREGDSPKDISFILDESVGDNTLNKAFEEIRKSKQNAGAGYDKVDYTQPDSAEKIKEAIERYRPVWKKLAEFSDILKIRYKSNPDDFAAELMYCRVMDDLRVHTEGMMNFLAKSADEKSAEAASNVERLQGFYEFTFGSIEEHQKRLDYMRCKISEKLKFAQACAPENPAVSKGAGIADRLCSKK